jgi:hypothetical protein
VRDSPLLSVVESYSSSFCTINPFGRVFSVICTLLATPSPLFVIVKVHSTAISLLLTMFGEHILVEERSTTLGFSSSPHSLEQRLY